jgi:hypothetical protein
LISVTAQRLVDDIRQQKTENRKQTILFFEQFILLLVYSFSHAKLPFSIHFCKGKGEKEQVFEERGKQSGCKLGTL